MTDVQTCPIDGTLRSEGFRRCRTCNFDFERMGGMPQAPARPAPAPTRARPVQPPVAQPGPSKRTPPRAGPAPSVRSVVETPAPPTAPSAADRWRALTAAADQQLSALPTTSLPTTSQPATTEVEPETDPWTGRPATDGWDPSVPTPATARADSSVPGRPLQPGADATSPADGGPAAPVTAIPVRVDAIVSVLARAGSVAGDVGAAVAREGRRWDRTVVRRWPKYRWPIHGATALVGLLALWIPFSAPPPRPTSAAGPGQPAVTPVPTVLARLVILDPPNGSAFDADHYVFRGTGPAGATVVEDVPLADDPTVTIGPDGTWSLPVDLGPGENWITLRLGGARSTQVVWSVTSKFALITPTPEPTPVGRALVPAPGAPPAFAPVTFKGKGNAMRAFTIPDDAVAIATITHKGKRTFVVSTLDATGARTGDVVVTRGAYQGTRLFDVDHHSSSLRITADGAWTVTIKPVGAATVWDGLARLVLKGSEVVRLPGASASALTLQFVYLGKRPYLVVAHRQGAHDTVVSSKAAVNKVVTLPEGTVLLEVIAGGSWSVAPA